MYIFNEELLSSKLYDDNIFSSFSISDIINSLLLTLQLHSTFLESLSYSENEQLFSHNEKLL